MAERKGFLERLREVFRRKPKPTEKTPEEKPEERKPEKK